MTESNPHPTLEEAVDHIASLFDDGFQFKDLMDAVPMTMEIVENLGGLTGEQKKEKVLQIVDRLLDRTDLPGPDWLTKKAIMWFLPAVIDKLVAAAKNQFNF